MQSDDAVYSVSFEFRDIFGKFAFNAAERSRVDFETLVFEFRGHFFEKNFKTWAELGDRIVVKLDVKGQKPDFYVFHLFYPFVQILIL